jgi:hypothetical protein
MTLNKTLATIVSTIVLCVSSHANADLPVALNLQVNGQTSTVTLTPLERLIITVQASPRPTRPLSPMDWWILASTSFGLFGYDGASQQFVEGLALAEQSPLINQGQSLTILDYVGLPVGYYYVYLVADLIPNGALDTELGYQQVTINIIPNKETRFEYRSNFTEGLDSWEGGFADLPLNADHNLYELEYAYELLPAELNRTKAPMLQSHNRSDDVFMFITRSLSGLKFNTTYLVTFDISIASNAPSDAIGIGGPPGESVFVKAGITHQKPQPVPVEGYWRMNVDKGNQSQGGTDAIVLGNIAVNTPVEAPTYQIKTLKNETPFELTTGESDTVWLMIGTDSGFEGKTKLYFPQIYVTLQEI